MTPCALYLRYSSDRQNERSPEDQEAVCRPFMERLGFSTVAVYVDRAKSGATVHERHDFQRMLADARAGRFQAVCAEMTSRYGRDEEDRAAARKRLTFAGVAIYTAADGLVSRMIDGIKAVMDANQLEDLKVMVRRGMAGVIRDGRHAGGLAYGYESVPGQPGVLEIVEYEARIVARIFAEYIAGAAPRVIAGRLNAEGVPPPRGAYWRASTINGHTKRKTGILQNELFCGRLIWNRAYRVRDPDTGARIWRYKPESEWHRADAPQLRIIDDATFAAAQGLRAQRARRVRTSVRPKRILSGLLRCGSCGAGMSKKDIDHGRPRIVCTRMKESQTCDNRRVYYLDDIEARTIGGLREQLGTREAVAHFVRCYNEERRRASNVGPDRRRAIAAEIADVERHIDRAVAAIIDGRITQAEGDAHLPALRGRRVELQAEQAALQAPSVIALRLPAVEEYVRNLDRLANVVNADLAEGDDGLAQFFRKMVETVTVMPAPAPERPKLVLAGDLGSLLDGVAAGVSGGAGWASPSDPPKGRLPYTLILGDLRAA